MLIWAIGSSSNLQGETDVPSSGVLEFLLYVDIILIYYGIYSVIWNIFEWLMFLSETK